MQKFALFCCLLVFWLSITGCSGKFASEQFMRDDIDMSAVTRIAVLPFQNNTNDKFISEQVRNVAITQVLAYKVADVVDRAVVDSVMSEEVIDPRRPVDTISLKRLAQRLQVQAFLVGSVDMARTRSGGYPLLAVTLRLVEAQSGIVLWQNSGRWNSETVSSRIFGSAPTDSFHVTLNLMSRMMKPLANK